MALAMKEIYQTDTDAEESLLFVASDLEKRIKCPIMITDHNGLIHYPKISPLNEYNVYHIDIRFTPENKYLYYESGGSFYYPVVYEDTIAYIIIKNLSAKRAVKILDILVESKLAIKYYFASRKINEQITLKLQNQLAEYLFLPGKKNITDIAKLSEKYLNPNMFFCVILMETGNLDNEIKSRIYSYINDYVRIKIKNSLLLSYSKYFIFIAPECFQTTDCRLNQNYNFLLQLSETIKKQYDCSICQGIGTSYTFFDIKKSFNEAMIALKLPLLLGQNDYVQYFAELGVFTQIFRQDPNLLSDYAASTLSPLIDYDRTNNGCLLMTLRKLLDLNLNYKAAAKALFIHINTLYYRKNKIEELLGINLSQMNNMVNLYIALKLWDLFQD